MQVTVDLPEGQSAAAAARRAQIINAAIETIAELGYGRASFAQIAKRAGISSTRLISYHFAGKDDLIRAVVDEAFGAAAAFMRPRFIAEPTRAGMLSAYIRANVEFMRSHPAHIRAVVEIAANARSEDGTPVADLSAPHSPVALLVRHFEQGQQEGEFRAFDPQVMAVTIRAAIDALAGRLATDPDLNLDQYAEELVRLFDRATRRDPS